MRAKLVYEKFVKDSDPISDMNIGIISGLRKIENDIMILMEVESKEETLQFDIENNLNVNNTYTIDVRMDTFGRHDIFELHFIWNKNEKIQFKMDVFALDDMNLNLANFTIKEKSLSEFRKKLDRDIFWDIFSKKEKRISQRKAENLGLM